MRGGWDNMSELARTTRVKGAFDHPVFGGRDSHDGRAALGSYGSYRGVHGGIGDVSVLGINQDELVVQE